MAIWTYTHCRGAWTSVDGMQASCCKAVFIPLTSDVGSAKQSREHPPVHTGLNFAVHGSCGALLENKSVFDGLNPLAWMKSLCDKILLRRVLID